MRADFIRIYKVVHTWTGIVAGMALFIAFYAGAITVFKEPLARWASAPTPAQSQTPLPLQDMPALIARTLATYPQAGKDFVLYLHPGEHHPPALAWQERTDEDNDHDQLLTRHYRATLDAAGSAQVHPAHPSKLAEFIDVLHRVVGLPMDTDNHRWLMGAIAVLYAVALVSGVVVLLPSLVKDLFALRAGKNAKRMWLDAHNVVGLFSLPFHIVMAVTAIGFAFHDDIYALQNRLVHGGALSSAFAPGGGIPPAPKVFDPAALLSPAALLQKTQALSPRFEPTMLQYTQVQGPRPALRIWGHAPDSLSLRAQGGFVALDPYTGRVINADYMPGRQDAAHTVLSGLFALHFATFGGTPVQWMYFVLGLAGAWLFYSGNLLWVESRRKQQRKGAAPVAQRRDVRAMAAATVGVCLGAVCGMSCTIAAAKWLYTPGIELVGLHQTVYYLVFFASIAWAFAWGAARAAVHLLWLAAAATLAIALPTALAWGLPAVATTAGLWANTSAATLGVDATACVAALGWAWAARATARRARLGAADSVWAAAPASPTGGEQQPCHSA